MHGWFTDSLCDVIRYVIRYVSWCWSLLERSALVRRDRLLCALVPPLRAVYQTFVHVRMHSQMTLFVR